MEKAYFKDIRQVILQELSSATKSVKVAVAWFTNQDLFEKLCEKAKEGLDVELIIIDDFINNGDHGLAFQEFINKGGKLRYGNFDHPMHHKFCIIDNTTLINGSYNWTYYAESKNVENIALSKDNYSFVEQYTQEFERLKSMLSRVTSAIKREFDEIEAFDYFAVKEYLANDLYFRGRQNLTVKHVEAAARLLPNNKAIQQEYKAITEVKIIKKTTTSLGIETRMNGEDGRFSILIKKGTPVPFSKSGKYSTVEDNQTSISITTYKGIDDFVVNNHSIGSFLVKDLPAKPKGQASLTVTLSLSEQGKLTVTAKNNETGSQMEATYDVDKLVF